MDTTFVWSVICLVVTVGLLGLYVWAVEFLPVSSPGITFVFSWNGKLKEIHYPDSTRQQVRYFGHRVHRELNVSPSEYPSSGDVEMVVTKYALKHNLKIDSEALEKCLDDTVLQTLQRILECSSIHGHGISHSFFYLVERIEQKLPPVTKARDMWAIEAIILLWFRSKGYKGAFGDFVGISRYSPANIRFTFQGKHVA